MAVKFSDHPQDRITNRLKKKGETVRELAEWPCEHCLRESMTQHPRSSLSLSFGDLICLFIYVHAAPGIEARVLYRLGS